MYKYLNCTIIILLNCISICASKTCVITYLSKRNKNELIATENNLSYFKETLSKLSSEL